jgi:hypothetical protein
MLEPHDGNRLTLSNKISIFIFIHTPMSISPVSSRPQAGLYPQGGGKPAALFFQDSMPATGRGRMDDRMARAADVISVFFSGRDFLRISFQEQCQE